jgi:hypothetical protein
MFRILPELLVAVWMVEGVHAMKILVSADRSKKRSDAQRTNLIAGSPRRSDLIGLAIHFAHSMHPTGATL